MKCFIIIDTWFFDNSSEVKILKIYLNKEKANNYFIKLQKNYKNIKKLSTKKYYNNDEFGSCKKEFLNRVSFIHKIQESELELLEFNIED